MKRILVIDPQCRWRFGHFYPTSKSLLGALHGAIRYVVIHRKAEPELDFGPGITVWPWPDDRTLAGRMFRGISRSRRYRESRSSRNVKTIMTMIDKAGIAAGDAIIVHSTTLGLAMSLVEVARVIDPALLPALHLRFLCEEMASDLLLEAHNSLASAARRFPKINIYSETKELGDLLETKYNYPAVRQWLLPMIAKPSTSPAEKSDPSHCFVVGMLGGRRKEQGIDTIPEIVKSLLANSLKRRVGQIRILIQRPAATPTEYEKRFIASLLHLGSESRLQLEFLDPVLSDAAFCTALNRSHVLLLPYDIDAYRTRGSGLIIEAAMTSTPIIVANGLAMANWQELAGSPRASEPSEYANAVFDVAEDYSRYREGAIRAGSVMRRAMAETLDNIYVGGS